MTIMMIPDDHDDEMIQLNENIIMDYSIPDDDDK